MAGIVTIEKAITGEEQWPDVRDPLHAAAMRTNGSVFPENAL